MSFEYETLKYVDTKSFRQCVLEKANARLGLILKTLEDGNGSYISKDFGLLSLLDSTYKSEVPSTIYAMHLKALAFEAARFLCITEDVIANIYFTDTKGEYLSQNVASFLFPKNRFSQTDSTDVNVRNFYLSIIEAYFGGSTKSNIERALLRFLGLPVGLIENFLIARDDPTQDEIVRQFTFDITVNVDDPRVKNVDKLQKDIEFLLSIIKPAHTSFQTKFIFQELFDVFRKGCTLLVDIEGNPILTPDGFEIKIKQDPTAICETLHSDMFDYYYEDFRKTCGQEFVIYIDKEDISYQASPRIASSVIGGTWSNTSPYIYHTKTGPLGKASGVLANNVSDVSILINNVPIIATEIYPLSSAILLPVIPSPTDIVQISYYSLKQYVGALMTNDLDSVLNNWSNSSTEFDYKTVLSPTNYNVATKLPLELQYRYSGFDLYNSSVMNSPFSLEFNQNGVRNRLNDYTVFKSYEYNLNKYNTTLNEGTPLFPKSLNQSDYWRRLPFQEIRLNNSEFIMNNLEDRLFGEIHIESYHPFYSALTIESSGNGGEPGLLRTLCEDPLFGVSISQNHFYIEDIPRIGKDLECIFTTNLTLTNSECGITDGAGYFPENFDFYGDLLTQIYPIFGGISTRMHSVLIDFLEEITNQFIDFIWDDTNPYTLFNGQPTLGTSYGWIDEIVDKENEYYKTEEWFVTNISTLANNATGFTTLLGSKLKESNIEIIYDILPIAIAPFTLNGNNLTNERIFPLHSGSPLNLIFYSRKKIMGIPTRIRNVTAGLDYYLPGATLSYNHTVSLDNLAALNMFIGLNPGDIIEADFITADTMNQDSEFMSIFDSIGFKLFLAKEISQVTRIFNVTKNAEYDLTNLAILYSGQVLDIDETLLTNSSIGMDPSDIIFAELIMVNNSDETEPLLTVGKIAYVTTNIIVEPV